jgi:hypothetical protein
MLFRVAGQRYHTQQRCPARILAWCGGHPMQNGVTLRTVAGSPVERYCYHNTSCCDCAQHDGGSGMVVAKGACEQVCHSDGAAATMLVIPRVAAIEESLGGEERFRAQRGMTVEVGIGCQSNERFVAWLGALAGARVGMMGREGWERWVAAWQTRHVLECLYDDRFRTIAAAHAWLYQPDRPC